MWSFLTLPLNINLICVASQHIIPTLRLFLKTFKNFPQGKNNFPWESHGKSEIPKTIISNITIRCIAYQLRLWIGFVYVFQTCISIIPYKSHKKGTLAPLKSSPSFQKTLRNSCTMGVEDTVNFCKITPMLPQKIQIAKFAI